MMGELLWRSAVPPQVCVCDAETEILGLLYYYSAVPNASVFLVFYIQRFDFYYINIIIYDAIT